MRPPALAVALLAFLTTARAEELGGWRLNQEYRFVWTKDQRKVGETTFTLVKVDRPGAEHAIELRSSRSYDDQVMSQRAKATTHLNPKGQIQRFEESLELQAKSGGKAQQQTAIEIAGGKAKVQFRQNDKPTGFELNVGDETHLTATSAVEHWILFAAGLPKTFKQHEVSLLYPEFRKTIQLRLVHKGTETIQVGAGKTATERYEFAAPEDNLQGTIWRDEQGRLVQIEFPNKLNPLLTLRVVLAGDTAAAAKK